MQVTKPSVMSAPSQSSQVRTQALQNKQAIPTVPFLNSCPTERITVGLSYASKFVVFCHILLVSGTGAIRFQAWEPEARPLNLPYSEDRPVISALKMCSVSECPKTQKSNSILGYSAGSMGFEPGTTCTISQAHAKEFHVGYLIESFQQPKEGGPILGPLL